MLGKASLVQENGNRLLSVDPREQGEEQHVLEMLTGLGHVSHAAEFTLCYNAERTIEDFQAGEWQHCGLWFEKLSQQYFVKRVSGYSSIKVYLFGGYCNCPN